MKVYFLDDVKRYDVNLKIAGELAVSLNKR